MILTGPCPQRLRRSNSSASVWWTVMWSELKTLRRRGTSRESFSMRVRREAAGARSSVRAPRPGPISTMWSPGWMSRSETIERARFWSCRKFWPRLFVGSVPNSSRACFVSLNVIGRLVAFFAVIHKADVNNTRGTGCFFHKLFTAFLLEGAGGGWNGARIPLVVGSVPSCRGIRPSKNPIHPFAREWFMPR